MTDLALQFDSTSWSADLALVDGALATDDGIVTAIVISLFSDARARADDPIPVGSDPRGWWGDAFGDDPSDRIGSRLWQLARGKAIETTALAAHETVREALAWMIADGVASAVDIEARILPARPTGPSAGLQVGVTVHRPDGPTRQRFDFLWDATARSYA
jgi:phage gp46-like protein